VSLHASALATLSAWPAPDSEQELLRKEYVEVLHSGAASVSRTGRPGHLTASGIILDPAAARTLLVLHAKLGLWVQPGGHCESGDDSLRSAALRECAEETGVSGLEVSPSPVVLSRHCAPCGADTHFDVQYLVVAPAGAQPSVSDESHDVRWFSVAELPDALADGVQHSVTAAVRAVAGSSLS
jgi:8-oxo-dGTP pyrophosphatase MutT (NUDIX family)